MSATNRGTLRRNGDYYRTPSWTVEALLAVASLEGPILEPGCGDGAILTALAAHGLSPLTGIELERGLAETAARSLPTARILWGDFLDEASDQVLGHPAIIIGNPPYTQAEAFVRRGLGLLAPAGHLYFLLRVGFLETRGRRDLFDGRQAGFAGCYALSRRPSFTGRGTDATTYAWFHWCRCAVGVPRVEVLAC